MINAIKIFMNILKISKNILFVLVVFLIFSSQVVKAQAPDEYLRARVLNIISSGKELVDGEMQDYQKVVVEILNGAEKGQRLIINHGSDFVIQENQKVQVGEIVVVDKISALKSESDKPLYNIIDKYRINGIVVISLIFFALAIYFGRMRGLTSIIGMIFSMLIIFYYIIPSIVKGNNPFISCLIGAFFIILFSLYLSHGFNKRTSIALVATLMSLGLAVLVDLFFVYITKLTGSGAEEVFYLQFDKFTLDLKGLLLGGIIIGVLGVLDDVTTGQSAAVEEIHLANKELSFFQLYKSGISVGREHIASLVNTLVLAYVGVSLPLLLLYSTAQSVPLWITFNNGFIAEEIVRTLVGSTVLVMAVPLTTILAAYYYSKKR